MTLNNKCKEEYWTVELLRESRRETKLADRDYD